MEFLRVEKGHEGNFLYHYNLVFRNKIGKEKPYEVVSRKKNISTLEDYCNNPADGVTMIMHNEDDSKLLLIHEYRMALGQWIYSFPAGLIDPGETPEMAAARELHEETGLHLDSIETILDASYNAIGITNEKVIPIVGVASGSLNQHTSPNEDISVAWYSKEEVRHLLKTQKFAARSQAYCYLWSK